MRTLPSVKAAASPKADFAWHLQRQFRHSPGTTPERVLLSVHPYWITSQLRSQFVWSSCASEISVTRFVPSELGLMVKLQAL